MRCLRFTPIGLLVAACSDGGGPGPPVPGLLAPTAGADQVAAAGTALPESLAVVVRTSDGTPLGNVTVNWTVATGGGGVSPPTSVTGANGIARSSRTLGPNAVRKQ